MAKLLISKIGSKHSIATQLAVSQIMVMPLIFFNLERGVRQGCPLSGTLFVLGIKILALVIKQNPKIKGIRVGAQEIKIKQYPNDTTVLLKNPELMSLLLDLLEKFERFKN